MQQCHVIPDLILLSAGHISVYINIVALMRQCRIFATIRSKRKYKLYRREYMARRAASGIGEMISTK